MKGRGKQETETEIGPAREDLNPKLQTLNRAKHSRP